MGDWRKDCLISIVVDDKKKDYEKSFKKGIAHEQDSDP